MPSNRELTNEAQELAQTLGVDADTRGLNNAGLSDLVSGLRAELHKRGGQQLVNSGTEQSEPVDSETDRGPTSDTVPDTSPPPEPLDGSVGPYVGGDPVPRKSKFKKPKHPFYVLDGKSIVVHRGVLGPGDEVKASDFANGEEQLDLLVERKYVGKS